MASAMDCSKGKLPVVTCFNVASDLAIHVVLIPCTLDRPVLILNPGLSAVCADHHISITGVLEDPILILEVSVDLNGSRGI